MRKSVGKKLANFCSWSYGSLKLRDLIVNGLISFVIVNVEAIAQCLVLTSKQQ